MLCSIYMVRAIVVSTKGGDILDHTLWGQANVPAPITKDRVRPMLRCKESGVGKGV